MTDDIVLCPEDVFVGFGLGALSVEGFGFETTLLIVITVPILMLVYMMSDLIAMKRSERENND